MSLRLLVRRSVPFLLSLVSPMFIPSMSFAHSGHGSSGDAEGLLHYILEPEHAITWVLVIIAATAIGFFFSRRFGSKTR